MTQAVNTGLAGYVGHAERYGVDQVLETAEHDLGPNELVALTAKLPGLRDRHARRLNPRVHQLASRSNTIPHRDFRRERLAAVQGMLRDRLSTSIIANRLGVSRRTAQVLVAEARALSSGPRFYPGEFDPEMFREAVYGGPRPLKTQSGRRMDKGIAAQKTRTMMDSPSRRFRARPWAWTQTYQGERQPGDRADIWAVWVRQGRQGAEQLVARYTASETETPRKAA